MSYSKFMLIAVAFILSGFAINNSSTYAYPSPNSLRSANDEFFVYLPLIQKSCPNTISGRLIAGGSEILTVASYVHLRFFNGTSWSTISSVDARYGNFSFTNLPNLATGQKYYVLFLNGWPATNSNWSNYVDTWATREVTTFGLGGCVDLGIIDIARPHSIQPNWNTLVNLPYPFKFSLRTTTIVSDVYQISIYDPEDWDPYYESPFLAYSSGYNGSFTLTTLPNSFVSDGRYDWAIWVYDLNGGVGASFNPSVFRLGTTGTSSSQYQPHFGGLVPFVQEPTISTRDFILQWMEYKHLRYPQVSFNFPS